ncbi:hypothetical protein [Mesorhizobium sp. M1342]|uniref:hypothetical protein n=1 Tax=Mesorhizobium sp. M1342 TaxID=2957088 RepID=UPI003337EA27
MVLQHRMNGAPIFALEISERKVYFCPRTPAHGGHPAARPARPIASRWRLTRKMALGGMMLSSFGPWPLVGHAACIYRDPA